MTLQLRHVAKFRFHPKKPYSFVLTVRKPAGWSWFTPFEIWKDDVIWSGFWLGDEAYGVKARATAGGATVLVDVFARARLSPAAARRLEANLRKALGIDDDLRPFYRLMRKSRVLAPIAKRLSGMREGWGFNLFPALTLAVLLQMAPIKRSEEMWDCLVRRYGDRLRFDGKSVITWPREKTIARISPHAMAKACRLGYRAKFLSRIAKQLVRGFPTMEELAEMSPEAAQAKLMELYGVGEYSAGFATPHPSFSLDVWSVRIFHRILFHKPTPGKDPRLAINKTTRAAEKAWGPWRNTVFTHVLNDLPYLEKRFGIAAD